MSTSLASLWRVPDAALLVLSRALSAPRQVCQDAATAAGVDVLLARRVAALLFLHARGAVGISELAAFLDRTTGQPQVAAFRRLGLVTLAGAARDRRLSLTAAGARLASVFADRLDPLWSRATAGLSTAHQAAVLHALWSVGGRPAVESDTAHFPIGLIVVLDALLAQLVRDTLSFVDNPELGEAAVRPLLLLAPNPATASALGVELGIGAAAVNLGMGPALGIGLVERHQNRLHLTMSGNQAVRRITLASDAFWLDIERAGGGHTRADAQMLLGNLGRDFPASARS